MKAPARADPDAADFRDLGFSCLGRLRCRPLLTKLPAADEHPSRSPAAPQLPLRAGLGGFGAPDGAGPLRPPSDLCWPVDSKREGRQA